MIGRNKYLRDPSVQSGPGGYQPGPIDTQPGFGGRQGFMQPGAAPVQPAYNPINPPQPAFAQTTFNTARNFNQAPNVPMPSVPAASNPPSMLNPIQSNNSYPSGMNPPDMLSNGLNNSPYYGETETGIDAIHAAINQAPSGWNDPPPLSSSKNQVNDPYYKIFVVYSRRF